MSENMPIKRRKKGAPITAQEWQYALELIAQGYTLRQIDADPRLPRWWSLDQYMQREPERVEQYTRARERATDSFEAEIIEISRDLLTNPALTKEYVAAVRVHTDNLKWSASRRAPKKYGDKQQIEHSGTVTTRIEDMTDEQLRALAGLTDHDAGHKPG